MMSRPLPDHAFRRLAKAAGEADPPSTDHFVALIAVARGTVTAPQVEEARAEQRRRHAAGGAPESLGRILLQKGHLNALQYQEIVRLQPMRLHAVPPLPPRASVGRYRISGEIGQGGMGIVYRALDATLGREMALKVLRYSGDPRLPERLQIEARAMARLSHPNIVAIHQAGTSEGVHYLAMDLVPGESLAAKRGSFDLRTGVLVLEKVARALAYTHQRGVVHRDLKPGNILVRPDGEPVVIDFGLARIFEDGSSLTATGAVLGTPLYMAPEQIEGRRDRIGPCTDIYAMGAILYEMLTGRPPLQGASLPETVMRICKEDPPLPTTVNPQAPGPLAIVCMKALEKTPDRRYPSASAFADDLARWREGEPVAARSLGAAGRARRYLDRHRTPALLAAIIALAVTGLTGFLTARWVAAWNELKLERIAARERVAALTDLGTLWMKVVLARQDLFRAAVPPAQIRERIRQALTEIDQYAERYPNQPQGYFVRARARLALMDLRGAERDLRRAVGIDPSFSPAWALLGRTLIELGIARLHVGEDRAALLLLDQAGSALRQAAAAGTDSLAPGGWGLLAIDDDAALVTVSRALSARYLRNEIPEARRILEDALKGNPSEEYYLWLAYWEADPQRRLDLYARAIEIMPHCARAFLERGTARAKQADFQGALEDFSRAININPTFPLPWHHRAVARRRLGDPAAALADATRAVELDPSDAQAVSLCGLILYDMGDFKEATAKLSGALELNPRHAATCNRRGAARFRLGDLQGALADFEAALRSSPTYAGAYYNRGLLWLSRANGERALLDFSRAIGFDPDFGSAYDARARVREHQGDGEGAASDREHARQRGASLTDLGRDPAPAVD